MKTVKKIQRCRDCGFIDNPPITMHNLDKCPYCGNDAWTRIQVKSLFAKEKEPQGE